MLLCQISDLHIKANGRLAYGVVDTVGMLERCVQRIQALPQQPDVVIATGDLVDLGTAAEYGLLRELLSPLSQPVYLLPGNHDERQALRASFPDHRYLTQCEPFIQWSVDDYPVRLVGIDTVLPGSGSGKLCSQRLSWLDQTLSAAPKQPTVIAMHHPPFVTGIGHMDRLGLDGIAGLSEVVGRHPHVERVIAGHLHRSITVRFAGTVVSVSPSPAHQVALDLSPDAADQFVMEPPAFQLHWWNGSQLVTHTAFVDSAQGPYPFRENGQLID